jgi:excisionase family DNA binding protein
MTRQRVTPTTTLAPFMTVTEVARRLGRSTDSVKLYDKSGKLPALRTSTGLRLFARQDVEAFAKILPPRKGGVCR